MKKILKWTFRAVLGVVLIGLMTNKIYYDLFQAPELSYITRTYSVFSGIKSNDSTVKLFVNDEQVEKLYMTTIRLENSGGVALERNDFSAERDPLRITGQNIKSVVIDEANSRYNSETFIVEKNSEFLINFKWLNPGDYLSISILHNQLNSNIMIQGGFANVSDTKMIPFEQHIRRILLFRAIFLTLLVLFITITFFLVPYVLFIKLKYGVFWISYTQFSVYAYIISCKSYNKADRKRILREVAHTKGNDDLGKLMDKYCNKNKK